MDIPERKNWKMDEGRGLCVAWKLINERGNGIKGVWGRIHWMPFVTHDDNATVEMFYT